MAQRQSSACHSTIPARPHAVRETAAAYLRHALSERESGDENAAEATLRQALQLVADFAEALYQLISIRARRVDKLGARSPWPPR